MFTSINEIIMLSRENGYSFFDKERQRLHQTRVLPTLYYGRYFITEQIREGKKFFAIYKALKDGACDVVQGNIYLSQRSAERHINIYLNDMDIEEVSYELQ
jgi:hypothetical protein